MKPTPAGEVTSFLWWQRSAHEILPNLWVGGVTAAEDVEKLRTNRIALVLSIRAGGVSARTRKAYKHNNIENITFNKQDSNEEDLYSIFTETGNNINESLQKGEGILVHCTMGISRSVTIVVAYLIQCKKINPWLALNLVHERRNVACPNRGFMKQLEKWNSELEASREAFRKDAETSTKKDDAATVSDTEPHADEQLEVSPKSAEDTLPVLDSSQAHSPPSSTSPSTAQQSADDLASFTRRRKRQLMVNAREKAMLKD